MTRRVAYYRKGESEVLPGQFRPQGRQLISTNKVTDRRRTEANTPTRSILHAESELTRQRSAVASHQFRRV